MQMISYKHLYGTLHIVTGACQTKKCVNLILYICHAVILFTQVYFQLIAQYLVLMHLHFWLQTAAIFSMFILGVHTQYLNHCSLFYENWREIVCHQMFGYNIMSNFSTSLVL
jgi:hypothetical protein